MKSLSTKRRMFSVAWKVKMNNESLKTVVVLKSTHLNWIVWETPQNRCSWEFYSWRLWCTTYQTLKLHKEFINILNLQNPTHHPQNSLLGWKPKVLISQLRCEPGCRAPPERNNTWQWNCSWQACSLGVIKILNKRSYFLLLACCEF